MENWLWNRNSLHMAALIWSTLSILVIIYFLIANIFGDEPMGNWDAKNVITFLLFPIGLLLGLILAYKWPLQGGMIGLVSMVILFALRPHLMVNPIMYLLYLPSALNFLYGLQQKGQKS